MNPLQLKAVFSQCKDVSQWTKILTLVAPAFSIDTENRFCIWVAQCGHESAQFMRLRENMRYSAGGLRKTWPARFPTDEIAVAFARQPQKIANYVYANRLGNGDAQSNDGWSYRGGGIIQLTGRAQYKAAGDALKINLEAAPQKIEQPEVAARVAGWYWQSHGLNELADAGDFDKITETINGPAKLGLEERRAFYTKLRAIL